MNIPRVVLGRLSRVRRVYWFLRECLQDSLAYMRAATVLGYSGSHRSIQQESAVVRLSHVLEKGLCMPDFRPRFGADVLSRLQAMLRDPAIRGAVAAEQLDAARAVILAYAERHRELGIDISDMLAADTLGNCGDGLAALGGAKPMDRVSQEDAAAFFRVIESRGSVRDFDSARLPSAGLVEACVAAAIRSPSVCNRQTWRVHSYSGMKVREILALQNGNRGFGDRIPMLFIITSDMRQFSGSEERYQPWIEGGIFTMSFLLALHAKGLAAVSLNWSVLNATDRKLRGIADIPPHERTIVLIGCGYPAEKALVPISHRRGVPEVLTWHG